MGQIDMKRLLTELNDDYNQGFNKFISSFNNCIEGIYFPIIIPVQLRPEVAERLDQLTDGAAAAVLADYARRIVTGEIVPEDYRNIVAENATTTEG